ncbi:putative two-component response regulator [Sphingomonas changbaiensis NBRC 104936]|uniref:Putative two-component response regulator n=1 Tax=Sphingomonas changbaiensis NBRC 104936 TaxID=1219043 RepID=A0A0E9MT42_9SPHN|nr:response regulator transcription factor [Sphingomonas changbaiensis]GAO40917.1 putative two-component response regulator [Sphingomonas changbaiensis NBRC 104936]
MSGETILVVDDEAAIRRLLAGVLKRADYEVIECDTGREALRLAGARRPAAMLLDLGLPDLDGLEVLQQLRRESATPVLVVSVRDATEEKVAALDLGADDYVTKPFDGDELLARLRAALRRARPASGSAPAVLGDIAIDLDRRRVTRAGEEVHLAPKEYALLAELTRHLGRVLTHRHLLRAVWGPAHEQDVEYLRVAARGLRLKLESDPARPQLIRNEPGIGYRLSEPTPSGGG